MRTRIDPRVDFVFKKLLASPENHDLLLDFLNSVLALSSPIVEVQLINPYNERNYNEDKLSVVDAKSVDALGRRFQVEIQLQAHPALAQRVLYTWARVYQEQLSKGEDYDRLKPTYAIWLLDDVLIQRSDAHHHRFTLEDPRRGVCLSDHLAIHLIELPKWRQGLEALTPEDRWIYFFKSAGAWDELPPDLGDDTMRKAMGVLTNISQREHDRARYEGRLDQLRVKRIYEKQAQRVEEQERRLEALSEELERAASELDQKNSELDQKASELDEAAATLAAREAELARERGEAERLRAKLREAGLD